MSKGNSKVPYGKINQQAENIVNGAIDTRRLEEEIGVALEEAWQDGYDMASDEVYTKGFDEGKEEGKREAEERFKAREKVNFT